MSAPSQDDYRRAAAVLWGEAGTFIVDEFVRLNAEYFAGELPPLPMVIGITAYGRCVGLTRSAGHWGQGALPRITIASNYFAAGVHEVTDTILHEMIHAKLILAGFDPGHNGRPWCDEISRLSLAVVGCEVHAAPVVARRVPNPEREHNPRAPKTIVVRRPRDGYLDRDALATWPQSLREATRDRGRPIHVETH